jgi:hypothetical protein
VRRLLTAFSRRWDDWVPQERLRKLTEENKELASNLRKDHDAQRRAATGKPPAPSTVKRRPYGSELTGSSARGSEDRSSAVPAAPPRGTKRGREIEGIDKVSLTLAFSACSPSPLRVCCGDLTTNCPFHDVCASLRCSYGIPPFRIPICRGWAQADY